MPTLTPEESPFDPHADYRNTLASFELAFNAADNEGAVFNAGDGVRLRAGNMVATEALSYVSGADTIHFVVVQTAGDSGPAYRYQMQHVDEHGQPFGKKYDGIFLTNFGDIELENHSEGEGEHVRDWLTAARFDLFEAMLEAPNQVSTPLVEAVLAERAVERKVRIASRHARLERWLGWVSLLWPKGRRDPDAA